MAPIRGPTADGHVADGDAPLTWSESEHVRWKTPIHGRGWSSPVIWDDQIWMTTADDDGRRMFAVCLDRTTGAVHRDLQVFDVAEPREIHKLNSYASPTPVIEEGRVYVHFGSYGTAAIDTRSGEILWTRRDLPCDHYRGPGSSPILVDDLLVIHYDGFDVQYVVALDKSTGETVWKTDRSTPFGDANGDFRKAYSTPIVIDAAGRRQLISPGSKAAMSYDPATGEELWRILFDSYSSTSRPLFGHGLVFINTGFSKADLLAVRPDGSGDVTESHIVWKVTRSVPNKPSPLLIDNLLYLVHDAGIATALEASTGETVWTERLGGNYSASPVVVDGRIYITSHEGKTTVIQAGREYQELAVNQLDDGCMASPAVVEGAIYLRTTSALYRLEGKD